MFEKADKQLYSVGAFFFLISNALYLHRQLFSFVSHYVFPETTCGNSTLTPAIKQGQVCGCFSEAVMCVLGGKQSGNTGTSEIKG